jgi:hypothetical protein
MYSNEFVRAYPKELLSNYISKQFWPKRVIENIKMSNGGGGQKSDKILLRII